MSYGHIVKAEAELKAQIETLLKRAKAAELSNNASDAGQLPVVLQTVRDTLAQCPQQALADTGYRSEQTFRDLDEFGIELVVALGRGGKRRLGFERQRHPHKAQMADMLDSQAGQAAYRKRIWIAELPNGWIKNVLGFRQFSMRGLEHVKAEWKLVCMA